MHWSCQAGPILKDDELYSLCRSPVWLEKTGNPFDVLDSMSLGRRSEFHYFRCESFNLISLFIAAPLIFS